MENHSSKELQWLFTYAQEYASLQWLFCQSLCQIFLLQFYQYDYATLLTIND